MRQLVKDHEGKVALLLFFAAMLFAVFFWDYGFWFLHCVAVWCLAHVLTYIHDHAYFGCMTLSLSAPAKKIFAHRVGNVVSFIFYWSYKILWALCWLAALLFAGYFIADSICDLVLPYVWSYRRASMCEATGAWGLNALSFTSFIFGCIGGRIQSAKALASFTHRQAEKRGAEAIFELSKRYKEGRICFLRDDDRAHLNDSEKADELCRQAAELGYAKAQVAVARQENHVLTTIKWCGLAAKQGDKEAMSQLAEVYEQVHDYISAYMWFSLAECKYYRDMVAKKMTPSQIEEAQKLARERLANNYQDC